MDLDWLASKPFGDTLTVLEVLISFLGVGGGGYVATETWIKRRLRSEYRSDINLELANALDASVLDDTTFDARAFYDVVQQISLRAEALTWTERRGWRVTVRRTTPMHVNRPDALNGVTQFAIFVSMVQRKGGPLRRFKRLRMACRYWLGKDAIPNPDEFKRHAWMSRVVIPPDVIRAFKTTRGEAGSAEGEGTDTDKA